MSASNKMKAIVTAGDGTVEMVEITKPEIKKDGYEVLVKIKAVAICGTDGKFVEKTAPKQMIQDSDYPIVLGHECVGEVLEVGDKVRALKPGDLVMCTPTDETPIDGYSIFWGGMSQYASIVDYYTMQKDGIEDLGDVAQLVKLPNNFDPIASTAFYNIREAYNAIKYYGMKEGQSVVIYGAGPIGTSFIKVCKLMGMGPIISVSRPHRKETVTNAGADYIVNPDRGSIKDEVLKICPEGVDCTVDAAGVADYMNESLLMVKDGGKVNIFGEMQKNEVLLNWDDAPFNFNINISQMMIAPPSQDAEIFLLNAIDKNKLDLSDFVSDVFEMNEYKEAFALMKRRGNKKKIVIKFD